MQSVWEKGLRHTHFSKLEGDANTDVLIVGGGIAGILCALKLKENGVNCLLVEAKEICGGITKNTTAKITVGHGLLCDKLIRRYGEEKARLYLEAQLLAGREYRRICKDIDCDYETKDSYVYSLDDRNKIEKEILGLNRLGVKARFSDARELPFKTAGAVKISAQAQFDPLKFLFAVAKDLPICENTKITQFKPNKAVTNNGTITYKKLIVATHFPILNKHGLYPLKLFQHRSYVLALRGAQMVNGMYVDEADKGLSFRTYRDLLLLGGGGHRTGKQGGNWQELEDFAKRYYKNAEIVARWATQDCMSLDGASYVGRYSKSMPDVYVATGFNKWGMTNAMAAANILCDLIQDKQNPFAAAFSPSRSILHPQLAINLFESAIGLLTPTTPRCSHLGCALKYNKAEHTWDCSCHGSRFTEHGELIDNPATDDKRM